jgi:hypothetical protein
MIAEWRPRNGRIRDELWVSGPTTKPKVVAWTSLILSTTFESCLQACSGKDSPAALVSVVSFISVVPIVSKRVGSLGYLQALALHESEPINPLVSPPGARKGTAGLGTAEADLPAQRLTPPPMNEIFHDLHRSFYLSDAFCRARNGRGFVLSAGGCILSPQKHTIICLRHGVHQCTSAIH